MRVNALSYINSSGHSATGPSALGLMIGDLVVVQKSANGERHGPVGHPRQQNEYLRCLQRILQTNIHRREQGESLEDLDVRQCWHD